MRLIRALIVVLLPLSLVLAQTQSGGVTIISGGAVDHSAAVSTKPSKNGTGVPASGDCDAAGEVGREYVRTDAAAANASKYVCVNNGAGTYGWELGGTGVAAGPLGALVVNNGTNPPTVDIDATVVPRLASPNIWTGNNAWTPSTSQAISAAGNTILCNANIVQVDPNGTYTLSSTPTIADAANDGTRCTIFNLDTAFTLTIQDEASLASSNLRLGGSNIAIGPRQSATLIFSSTLGVWVREGISAASAGVTISSAGTGYFSLYPAGTHTTYPWNTGSKHKAFLHFLPFGLTISSSIVYFEVGLTASKGFALAVYSVDGNTKLGSSDVFTTASATQGQKITWTTPLVLSAGFYWFTFASDDTAIQLAGPSMNATVFNSLFGTTGSTATTYGYAANDITGTGGSIAFPSTLGGVSPDGNVPALHAIHKP